jgi:hypothetical protein
MYAMVRASSAIPGYGAPSCNMMFFVEAIVAR